MKKINKLLFIFFMIFINIKLVNAFTSDNCAAGYNLVGDYTCFKSVPLQNNGCTNDYEKIQGKECISYYNLEQPSYENKNCEQGYTPIGGYCFKYMGSAILQNNTYYCPSSTVLGASCYEIKKSIVINQNNYETKEDDYEEEKIDYEHICTTSKGVNIIVNFIGTIIMLCRFIVPILIIALGMTDFAKAVISNDDKAISKSSKALIRRFVAGVTIFFIPTLIEFGVNAIDKTINGGLEKDNAFKECTICVFNYTKCK